MQFNLNLEKAANVPLKSRLFIAIHNGNQCISPSILRKKGFTITKDSTKCDYILIADYDIEKFNNKDYTYDFNSLLSPKNFNTYKDAIFIKEFDLITHFKALQFSKEIYDTIKNYFKTNAANNYKMATSLMAGVNWIGNEIYLNELLNDYYDSCISGRTFRYSVAIQCFLNEINLYLGGRQHSLYSPNDYIEVGLVKNQDHINYVYNKIKGRFEQDIESILSEYHLEANILDFKIADILNHSYIPKINKKNFKLNTNVFNTK